MWPNQQILGLKVLGLQDGFRSLKSLCRSRVQGVQMLLRCFLKISTVQKDWAGDQRVVAVFWLGARGGCGGGEIATESRQDIPAPAHMSRAESLVVHDEPLFRFHVSLGERDLTHLF